MIRPVFAFLLKIPFRLILLVGFALCVPAVVGGPITVAMIRIIGRIK